MCGCNGGSPLADSPVNTPSALSSETYWLGTDAMPAVMAPAVSGGVTGGAPAANDVTGSVSISTTTALLLVVLIFVGLPALHDLL